MIVKHNNPCGVAIGEDALDAYETALACDPMSAFGGVIALNRPIDEKLAEALHENFVEVLIAPGLRGARRSRSSSSKESIRILRTRSPCRPTRASATSSGFAAGCWSRTATATRSRAS